MVRRVTVAIDENAEKTLQKLSKELGVSYSFLVRQAIKLLSEMPNPALVKQWCSLLQKGEHVIVDLDHLCLLLQHVEKLGRGFYRERRRVSESHARQLKGMKPLEYLKRLEACNLCRLVVDGDNHYTLVQPSPVLRKFVRSIVEETLQFMGYRVRVEEDVAKLRIEVREPPAVEVRR
jgi:hypothetical protein